MDSALDEYLIVPSYYHQDLCQRHLLVRLVVITSVPQQSSYTLTEERSSKGKYIFLSHLYGIVVLGTISV